MTSLEPVTPAPRVLLVSYYYPPSGGSGVQRALKMSRYLPDFGWDVTVLTVDPAHAAYPDVDPSMLADVPAGVAVERTRAWDPYAAYARLLGKPKADAVGVGFANAGGAASGKERLARWLRANVFLPDARVGWVPYALRRARALHAAHPFDVVLTTAPPMSLHLIGLRFASATGVPWVADFRDPWTDVYFLRDLPRTSLAVGLDRALEAAVLRRATRAVAVSASLARLLGGKVGRAVDVIPNGFDEADFPDSVPAPRPEAFTLAYVGNFLGQQDPAALWRALARLRASGDLPALRLRLVGNVDPAVAASIDAHRLGPVTERVPYVPHADAVAEMRAASVLLLAINRVEGAEAIVTGKLFEYVASGRPVLGVGPARGDAAAFLRETGAGELFDWDDEAGIEAFVRKHAAAWAAGTPLSGATPEAARPLTRRDQARKMGDVLRAAMGAPS